jgi:hypothetical protein
MKTFLLILLIIVVLGFSLGFIVKSENEATGDLIIGSSIVLGFFILMPIFIYHRWKNRSVKDYMLTRENIEKMRDYQKDNKI